MVIHFICTGNIYRSRLCEAYLNSLELPNITAISSGTKANRNLDGPVSWVAARLFRYYKLVPFASPSWIQTTKENLLKSDLVIYMEESHQTYCKNEFQIQIKNAEIWDIKDLDNYGLTRSDLTLKDDIKRIRISDKTFKEIQQKVDQLAQGLRKMSIQ